jgi:hypothetical protein
LFWQITNTTPWRRMILHFSHIGLTDGRTFMIPFKRWVPAIRLWPPLRLPLPNRGLPLRRPNSHAHGQDSRW